MSETWQFALLAFSAIFFVVDPFAVIPVYLSITHAETAKQKRSTALRASIAATATLLLFAFAGGLIFKVFGITMTAFKIAGGILLFRMALDMMQAQRSRARTSPEEEREGIDKEDVAIVPLGVPMLAGPGAIATVTVLMSQAWPSRPKIALLVASVLVTGVLIFVLFMLAARISKRLGRTGINILNRLMGLILAAVAIQFVVTGVGEVVRDLMQKP